MNTAERTEPIEAIDRDLLQLQLQVARRADELAHTRKGTVGASADWNCWLEAEREVLARRGELAAPAPK